MATIDPQKAVAVLLTSAGWTKIVPGSLTIGTLDLMPPGDAPEADDYAFTCTDVLSHQIIKGRVSALLAVREEVPD